MCVHAAARAGYSLHSRLLDQLTCVGHQKHSHPVLSVERADIRSRYRQTSLHTQVRRHTTHTHSTDMMHAWIIAMSTSWMDLEVTRLVHHDLLASGVRAGPHTGGAQVLQGVVFRRSKRPLDVPVDQNRARKWNLRVILGLERSSRFFRRSTDHGSRVKFDKFGSSLGQVWGGCTLKIHLRCSFHGRLRIWPQIWVLSVTFFT